MEVIFQDMNKKERRFSPGRDIALLFPYVIAVAGNYLTKERLDEVSSKLLEEYKLQDVDLMKVMVDFCRFIERIHDPAVNNPKQGLEMVGFFNSHPVAIMLFMYRLGVVYTGIWFDAVKRSNIYHELPTEILTLIEIGKDLQEELDKKLAEAGKDLLSPVKNSSNTNEVNEQTENKLN